VSLVFRNTESQR